MKLIVKTFLNTIIVWLALMIALPSVNAQEETNKNQTVDPSLFSAMKYRSVGPTRGGRATAIAGVPEQPFTFYMGGSGSGVWKTEDAGTSWNNISDGQIKVGSIGAIAVANSDENVVYVGTGSAAPRGNISNGIGMYRSTDAGTTWKHVGLPKAGLIGQIQIHPKNPDLVYAAVLGNIFGPNPERGVYRSKDGGGSWEQVLFVNDSTGAVDITMDMNNPRVMYAGMWQAERKPWTLIDGGKNGGIYKTVDGGDTWKKLAGGLPTGLLGKIGISVSQANSNKVYAIIQAKKESAGGIYVSNDAGKKWSKVNSNHKLRQRGWYYSHITADPTDENTVYASNTGLYRSTDGGRTFDRVRAPHGDDHGVWVNPNNPKIMINCNDGGADVTLNGGKTWSTQLNQPTAEFYRVTVDNQFPYRLYAGQQDNSTISVSSKSQRGLTPYEDWFNAGGSESGDVAVDPSNPNIIYAGTYSGEITIMNRATGQVRQITAYPHYTEGTEMRDLKYRWQWNFPIAINPFNTEEVYHTSNYVHKSINGGQTWETISPDLTNAIDKYHDIPGGPIQHDATGVEVYSTIFAFEISPDENGVMWTGSDDGLIHVTKDGGKNWDDVTPKGMPLEGTVNKIELSSHQKGRAFAAVYKYRDNDSKPYIFMTNNYGRSWKILTDGSNGIPEDHFVRSVAEDPDKKGLLYAGTEFGVYVSFNEGKNWQPLQLNLPHVPITDLEVHRKDLVLSTQGRAFWILDDLSPLHEIESAKPSDDMFYPVRDVYRTSVSNSNPVFNFHLSEIDTALTYKFEIMDSKNDVILTYSNKAEKEELKLKIKKGHNQMSWNMRYPGPKLVDDLVSMVINPNVNGPRAVPGSYSVRLSAGEKLAFTKSFEILKDPRWTDIDQADYQAQFDLVQEMKAMITESHEVIKNLRAIRSQVTLMSKLSQDAGYSDNVKDAVVKLDVELTAVEDLVIQNKAKTSQDAINYPRVFTNHIGRLYGVLNNAQDKPTGGVLERYEDLDVEFEKIINDYQQLIDEIMPAFNNLLDQEKVGRIIVPYAIQKNVVLPKRN
jgi:photosystem II stability/assembly factor-like uncharacterized protein